MASDNSTSRGSSLPLNCSKDDGSQSNRSILVGDIVSGAESLSEFSFFFQSWTVTFEMYSGSMPLRSPKFKALFSTGLVPSMMGSLARGS